jgi:plastocyanin
MALRLRSRPGRALLAVLVLLVPATLGAVAASGPAVAAPATWTVLVGSQTDNMAIQGQRFLPGDITIDAGDTVTWKANSMEIHTVTFFNGGKPQATLPPLDPTDPMQVTPQGGHTMDGTSYFNSGVMTTDTAAGPLPVPAVASYSLTFPAQGTFTYYCLVHGVMMRGVVHVQPAGSPYPFTQAELDAEAAWQTNAINADGYALWAKVRAASSQHRVFTGADDGVAMLMRFVNRKVVIHSGQKVHFLNTMSMGAPHTVTFGAEPQGPALFQPSGDPTDYRGGDLHSGLMTPGAKFTVTFHKAGRFPYICALHDDMGMKGVVVVKP